MHIQTKYLFISVMFFLFSFSAIAQLKPTLKDLHPYEVTTPPVIDGVLDEAVWQQEPTIDDVFISTSPSYGEILQHKTKVWIAYDADNIYFAFYCYDTEPDKIRATISNRDNIFSDDVISIMIDTLGAKQSAYVLGVNPNGIQTDLLLTTSTEDESSDWVWYSAGKIQSDGYIVEVHMPLKNFRYKSGKDVEMGIVVRRVISRTGVMSAWPDIPPGSGILESEAKLIFKELNSQLKLEILPAVTYSSIWDRKDPQSWNAADDEADFGVSAKYGLTSAITLDATINPDFSQVESDSFQIIANQRYPIFYSEKRPFFMEVGDLFNLAGSGGDSHMLASLHTRKIIDPAWGVRVTGQLGDAAFGMLASIDEWPGREFEGEINPDEGLNANYYIGRAKFSLGGENFIGAYYSGREFGEDYNRVFGADMKFYFGGKHILQANYLHSFSNDTDGAGKTDGGEFTMVYLYDTQPLSMEAMLEDYAKGFSMDTAFYLRDNFTRATVYFGPSFYPDQEKMPWLIKINPYLFCWYQYDKIDKLDNLFFTCALRTYFTKQGYLLMRYVYYNEAWAGQNWIQDWFQSVGSVQITNWLYIEASLRAGDDMYYDKLEPFLGKSTTYSLTAQIQPTDNFTQSFTFTQENFDRALDGSDVYTENIFSTRTTYQFNENFFIRAIVQYDSYLEVVLTDILASFTLIPGTVLHVGYGSLHENLEWDGADWKNGTELAKYYQTTQSLFIKASYNFQF